MTLVDVNCAQLEIKSVEAVDLTNTLWAINFNETNTGRSGTVSITATVEFTGSAFHAPEISSITILTPFEDETTTAG